MGYFILHITATSLPFDSIRHIYCVNNSYGIIDFEGFSKEGV